MRKYCIDNGILPDAEIKNGIGAGGKTGVFVECMAIYYDFIVKRTGIPPKIAVYDGKAMNELIRYFASISRDKDDKASPQNALNYIFARWDHLEPFLQRQLRLVQINTNIVNIISQVITAKINKIEKTRDEIDQLINAAK